MAGMDELEKANKVVNSIKEKIYAAKDAFNEIKIEKTKEL